MQVTIRSQVDLCLHEVLHIFILFLYYKFYEILCLNMHYFATFIEQNSEHSNIPQVKKVLLFLGLSND